MALPPITEAPHRHDPVQEAEVRDPMPIYHRIYQVLRRRIVDGTYPIESQLPTETGLVEEFGVSRHTMRAALQLLVNQGLLHRRAGCGTFVRATVEGKHWASQSLDDMIGDNFGDVIVAPRLDFPTAGSPAAEEARHRLCCDAPAARITWHRRSAAGPCALSTIYVPGEFGHGLPTDWAAQLSHRRLLHMVEAAAGVEAQRVQQSASALGADAEAAMLLDVPPGTALLVLQRSYFDPSGRIIQASQVVARPDRGRSAVELFRARH